MSGEESPQGETEKRQVELLMKISNLESERKTSLDKLTKLRQTIIVLKNDKECVNEIQKELTRFWGLSEETQKLQKHDLWFKAKY